MSRICIILSILVLSACKSGLEQSQATTKFPKKPRNIILMIGDGMGVSQVTAGLYSNNNKLHLEKCKVVGLSKTHSASDLKTDSAAGATAIATGKKTYNGAISVDTDTIPIPTILEIAEGKGYATGLIATSEITHATPACFIAHQANRNWYEEIAFDFLKTDIDLFIGGGQRYFDQRRDGTDLLFSLVDNGYKLFNFKTPISDLRIPPQKKLAYFTAIDKPDTKALGRDYLPEAASFATDFLDKRSDKGFFLMIEGSQIDWGGHANNLDYVVEEMLDFDETVGKVLEFAEKDRHTLVIITADHETGGLAINPGSEMGKGNLKGAFTSGGHTSTMVPVFAYGPGAEAFGGIYDNTAIFDKMAHAMNLINKKEEIK